MFDMSWGEIMVIGGVALIVIGPKDLPRALRTVGQMTTKVRRMAGEFQSQFSEAMREAELDDVRKEVEGLNRDVSTATSSAFNPLQTIRDEIKGAVEARPATGLGTTYGADGQPSIAGGPVSGDPLSIDPVPAGSSALDPLPEPSVAPDHLYPETAELTPIVPLDPEALPLVPLPVDEPVLPAATPSGPEIAATQEARA